MAIIITINRGSERLYLAGPDPKGEMAKDIAAAQLCAEAMLRSLGGTDAVIEDRDAEGGIRWTFDRRRRGKDKWVMNPFGR